MEVSPDLLVLGVLAADSGRGSSKGLTAQAVAGVLLKKFSGCLPEAAKKRIDEWVTDVVLARLIVEGKVINVNAELDNMTPHYTLTPQALPTVRSALPDLQAGRSKVDKHIEKRKQRKADRMENRVRDTANLKQAEAENKQSRLKAGDKSRLSKRDAMLKKSRAKKSQLVTEITKTR